jgi:hypothetical protein
LSRASTTGGTGGNGGSGTTGVGGNAGNGGNAFLGGYNVIRPFYVELAQSNNQVNNVLASLLTSYLNGGTVVGGAPGLPGVGLGGVGNAGTAGLAINFITGTGNPSDIGLTTGLQGPSGSQPLVANMRTDVGILINETNLLSGKGFLQLTGGIIGNGADGTTNGTDNAL